MNREELVGIIHWCLANCSRLSSLRSGDVNYNDGGRFKLWTSESEDNRNVIQTDHFCSETMNAVFRSTCRALLVRISFCTGQKSVERDVYYFVRHFLHINTSFPLFYLFVYLFNFNPLLLFRVTWQGGPGARGQPGFPGPPGQTVSTPPPMNYHLGSLL